MKMSEGRTVRRAFLGTWLAAGVLATGYAVLVSGCTPVTPVVDPITPTGEIDSLEKAVQAWRAREIAEHEPIWKEESGPDGDPFSAGMAAYGLASATLDPSWSNEAVDAFDRALESNPGFALARAWRGAAHALVARDYPLQGLWQVVPGPGFVRLYHVKAAFSDLDAAVEAAPGDPVIRLIRASTYLSMPSIFGGGEEGRADFDKLRTWTGDPDSNPDYSDVLRSREWREQYYLSRARAMAAAEEHEDAARSWQRLADATDKPVLQDLAKWHRNLARRVAITGAGVIGSFGIGARALWEALGTSGRTFAPCTRYPGTLPCAEAVKPDLRRMLRSGQPSRMSLVSQLAIAAVHLALAQARLSTGKRAAGRVIGIVYGTSHGPCGDDSGDLR